MEITPSLALGVAALLMGIVLWLRRCSHREEMFTRDAQGRRTFTCAGCGRARVSSV